MVSQLVWPLGEARHEPRILSGNIQKTAESLLKITELPPKRWPQDFKKALEKHISEATSAIKSYTQNASPDGMNFETILKNKEIGWSRTKKPRGRTRFTPHHDDRKPYGPRCRWPNFNDITQDSIYLKNSTSSDVKFIRSESSIPSQLCKKNFRDGPISFASPM